MGGTAGGDPRSLGLAFAGAAPTALQNGSSGVITTVYTLLDASGGPADGDGENNSIIADGTSTTTSFNLAFLPGTVTPFYIGVTATLTPTTPAGNYTGTYEIVLTVP